MPATLGSVIHSKHWSCLSCRYSKAGLQGITSLKNKDRAVASILHSLAADNLLEVHIAFVHKDEAGSAVDCSGFWEMMEVLEEHHRLCDWIKIDGSPAGIEDVDFSPKEILQVTGRHTICRNHAHCLRCRKA